MDLPSEAQGLGALTAPLGFRVQSLFKNMTHIGLFGALRKNLEVSKAFSRMPNNILSTRNLIESEGLGFWTDPQFESHYLKCLSDVAPVGLRFTVLSSKPKNGQDITKLTLNSTYCSTYALEIACSDSPYLPRPSPDFQFPNTHLVGKRPAETAQGRSWDSDLESRVASTTVEDAICNPFALNRHPPPQCYQTCPRYEYMCCYSVLQEVYSPP